MQRRTTGIVLLQPIINMRKSFLYILCFAVACQLIGCGSGEEQRRQLTELEQQNHSGQPMLNDTLAEALVAYFDRHGSANERMRAKYILGRTYADMGELPRALETYYEAADCADTTAADCDFAKLSRIHAQSAKIYFDQVQPRSQLRELRLAEYYAKRGKDTLMSIECFSLQADVYKYLQKWDSVITISKKSSKRFEDISRKDRSAQVLYNCISSLIRIRDYDEAKRCIDIYESNSGLIDKNGNIVSGLEIYYYIKGNYYLEIDKPDSAEYYFRKEMQKSTDINNKIAGSKGLQALYEYHGISDSIAKYSNLGYRYNDSAYSLSEMQNIQKLQASYNYNHHKFLAEKNKLEARVAWLILTICILAFALIGVLFSKKYKSFKRVALDYRLKNAKITKRFKTLANSNPPQYPSFEEWKQLRSFVEHEIPSFHDIIDSSNSSLTEMEYDVCLLTRVHMQPNEIAKLKKCVPSYVSNIRRHLLKKVFNKEGSADEFDDEIGKIGNSGLL